MKVAIPPPKATMNQQQTIEQTTMAALAEAQGVLHEESFEHWKDYFNDFTGQHAKQHWIKAVGTCRGALQDTATKRPYRNMATAIRAVHQEEGGQMTSDTVHLLRLYDKSSKSHTFMTNM